MAGHDVQYGKHRTRRSFSRIKEVLDLPNLIEIQTDSFKAFLDHGLKEVFEDVLPISNFTDTMELEFVGYEIKEPKYTLEEARIHDASYSAPIFVTFPSHIGNDWVLSKRHFSIFHRRSVSDEIAFFNDIANFNKRTLVVSST